MRSFLDSLGIDTTEFRDWIVVGIFYAAIHYYEAYFARYAKHSPTHGTRDGWIAMDDRIKDTYDDYRELKQHRRQASHGTRNFSPVEIKNSILPKLENIKSKILSLA